MPIIDPFEAQQPQRRGIVDPFEAQAVQSIVDPFVQTTAKPQEETKNPLIGALGRAASLTGSGIEAVAEVAERLGDKLELAVPLSGISEEDIRGKKQLQPLFSWAKSLKDFDKDLGYKPSTQLKELGDNPLNAVPFIAERVLTSSPDMVAAVGVFPAYVMARTKEILDERVKNDEKTLDEATVGDVTAAATAAIVESTLERFATKGLLKATPGATKTGRIAKETGIQAGTEVAEEEAAYLGEAAGTKKGLSAEEALTRGAEAAIVGGGLGATVQGVKEVVAPKRSAIEEAAAEVDAANKGVTTVVRPPAAEGEAPTLETIPAEPTGEPDPERVAQLTDTFKKMDAPFPEEAAIEQATKEAVEDQEYARAQREAEGAAAAVEPVAGPSGIGAGVAVQPGAEPAPGGVGGVEPTGVVPAGPDVSQPVVGEGQAPAALAPTEAPASNLQTAIAEAEKAATTELQPVEEAALTGTEKPTPIVQNSSSMQAAPEYFAEIITPARKAIQEGNFKPVTLKDGTQVNLVVSQDEENMGGRVIALDQKGQEVGQLMFTKITDEEGNSYNPHAFVGEEFRRQGLATALYDLAEESGAKIPSVEQYGQIRSDEGQAFREAREAKAAPAEAVAPEAPKKKRGRPATLTPEQRVAKRAAVQAASRARGKAAKGAASSVDTAISALDTVLAPIDESTISTEEQLTDAERQKRLGKVKAIKALLLMQESMSKTDTARGKIEAALKNPAISAKEIADVKAGIAYEKSKVSLSEKGGQVGPPEVEFSKATTGSQALAQIIKTGNGFQRFVAQRLRGFVNGVEFVVLEKGDPLPEQLQQYQKEWNAARGLFVENMPAKTRTIYVRGASFGADHGIDHITVLHELLHAATGQKLSLGLAAVANKFSTDALLTRATRAFTRVMRDSSDAYKAMDAAGKVPDDLRALVESTLYVGKNGQPYYKIFELHQEFLAYGMTEPVMQKFLMTVEPTQAKGSAFNRFVRVIMDYFGIGGKDFSAMTDLVLITDKILSAKKTETMRKLERVERGENYEQVFASAKQTRAKVDKTVEKLQKSNFADDIKSGGYIEQLVGMRDQNKAIDVLVTSGVWTKDAVMQQLLPAMQTSAVVRWADKLGVVGLKDAWAGINKMAAMRNKATNDMTGVADKLESLASKDAKQYKAIGNVMHYSTIVSRDPNEVTTDKNLTALWDRLTPESKKLYNEVREFYADNHKAYHALLQEQIDASKLPGSASDPKSPKGKLIASIKQMYEDGERLYPYFPLMRYGQYWARVGKGKSREFQMFESQADRDRFVRERAKQLNAETGNKRTQEEMIEGGDIDVGNDLSSARKANVAASEMLKDIFNTLESKATTSVTDDFGNIVGNSVSLNMDKLKDDIYQMYLQTLPDRNFRRQFLTRQGIAGFSGDIHRNFVVTGTNMANQLARIKYGPEIMNDIERANDGLAGNPNKARLGEFVSEMRLRAEQQVRPTSEDGIGFQVSNFVNTSAFLWMMTSIKTMVAQFTAVPVFAAPVLASKHGVAKTAAALAKSLNVFNGVGITKTNPDGSTSYTMPSMSQLKGLTADEKLATQYMLDFGISDTTMAYDLGNRRNIATVQAQSSTRKIAKATANAMTALFHHSERMIREVTFMTSYRLNRDAGMTHEAALDVAVEETHEALGNYHASNRPRGLAANKAREVTLSASSPWGRSILQFKMFPAFVTTYFIRNGYNMFKGLTPQERKQAKIQFLGSLGMSYALAGYVGIPGISMAMGIIQGALNAMRDEDEDDPLEGRDFEFWFRNIWLPQTFGNVKIGGHTLDEFLDRGLISGLTGYDITSSMSMNNMWFPEIKDQATATAEMTDYLVSLAGPGVSLLKQGSRAVDYFNQGKILQGMEQLAPAIFRAPLTAVRYSQEGAQTTAGASIKDAEEFTIGQLLAQSAGFATEGLQARREAIFKIQGQMLEIKRDRSSALARLDLEILKGSDRDVEKAIDTIVKYNYKNYWDPITSDQISQSIKKRMERRLMSDRGFPIDKKYYPQVMDLLEPSGKKLEREAKK